MISLPVESPWAWRILRLECAASCVKASFVPSLSNSAPQRMSSRDPRGAFLNERAHGLAQTEPVARLDGVFEMDRDFVLVRQRHGDAALCVFAAALGRRILGHDEDLAVPRKLDCRAETGNTAADDEEVGRYMFGYIGHCRYQIYCRGHGA